MVRTRLALAAAVLPLALHARQPPAESAVRAEFRIFDGMEEITASTRLRVMPAGRRDPVNTVEGDRPSVALPPGIYDVQALKLKHGSIAAIRWAERLVIMHYPDEAGRHLEVINFQPGFGALQIRAGRGAIDAYEVAVFPRGDRGAAARTPLEGEGYRLFVLRAGRYDIRVRHAAGDTDARDAHWYLDVEVPADRTRLKQVEASDGPTPPFVAR